MAKQVRWGRVSAAVSTCIVVPAVLATTLLPEAIWEAPPGEDCYSEYELARARIEAAELEPNPERALERALEVMDSGVAMQQRGSLIEVAVGSAMGMMAIPVVQASLESDQLPDATQAEAIARLDALARHAADPEQVIERERAAVWSMLGESTRQRSLGQVRESLYWMFWGNNSQFMATQTDRILAKSEEVQHETSALVVLGSLRDYRANHGRCPDTLDEVGELRGQPPFAYDASRCELVVNTNPEEAPRIYRAH